MSHCLRTFIQIFFKLEMGLQANKCGDVSKWDRLHPFLCFCCYLFLTGLQLWAPCIDSGDQRCWLLIGPSSSLLCSSLLFFHPLTLPLSCLKHLIYQDCFYCIPAGCVTSPKVHLLLQHSFLIEIHPFTLATFSLIANGCLTLIGPLSGNCTCRIYVFLWTFIFLCFFCNFPLCFLY